jgi:hypothetical protein
VVDGDLRCASGHHRPVQRQGSGDHTGDDDEAPTPQPSSSTLHRPDTVDDPPAKRAVYWVRKSQAQTSLDRAPRMQNAKLGSEFLGDLVLAPLGMVTRNALDEGDVLAGDGWSTDQTPSRLPAPEQFEALAGTGRGRGRTPRRRVRLESSAQVAPNGCAFEYSGGTDRVSDNLRGGTDAGQGGE